MMALQIWVPSWKRQILRGKGSGSSGKATLMKEFEADPKAEWEMAMAWAEEEGWRGKSLTFEGTDRTAV